MNDQPPQPFKVPEDPAPRESPPKADLLLTGLGTSEISGQQMDSLKRAATSIHDQTGLVVQVTGFKVGSKK